MSVCFENCTTNKDETFLIRSIEVLSIIDSRLSISRVSVSYKDVFFLRFRFDNLKNKMVFTIASKMDCGDFLEFQDNLKTMRLLDDKIIYALNTSIPTESFKGQIDARGRCKDLYYRIKTGHAEREVAIQRCINFAKERVKTLIQERDSGKEDPTNIMKSLRKEQNKLRLLQAELNVEEVVKQQTTRVYTERCRSFYKPDSLDS